MDQLWNDDKLFIVALDCAGQVTYANAKAEERFCDANGRLVGAKWLDIAFLPEDRVKGQERLASLLAGEIEKISPVGDEDLIAHDGTRLRIQWSRHLLHDDGNKIVGVLSFGQDISEQKKAQFRLGLHQEVARIIGTSHSFEQAVETFMQTVCEQFGWDFGETWLYEKQREIMVWHSGWSREKYAAFQAISQNFIYPIGHGLPGVVWKFGKPLWIEDVSKNLTFLRREAAGEIGLHASFGFPIRVGGTIVGVIDFLSHRIQSPDEGLIELFDSVGIQLGNYYQRIKAEAQLKIWDELFRNSAEAMMILDADLEFLAVNDAFTRLTGYAPEDVAGEKLELLRAERQEEDFYRTVLDLLHKTGNWQGEAWVRGKDGEEYLQGLHVIRIRNDKGLPTHYIATFNDNSERKAAEEKIRYLVHHDALTGLPNRTLLFDRIGMAIAQAHRNKQFVVVFSIDVDRFKVINDSLGHDIGDGLLLQMARRLQKCIREQDTLSRPGGDEFVMVFPNVSELSAIVPIAEKIATTMRLPIWIKDREFNLTASIGISVYPNDGIDRETLLKNADAAMNFAKETGRNQYHFFTMDLSRTVSDRLRIETNLRKALDREEFVLYYQPQIDIRSRRVVGMEALIRWNQPEEGMVPPGKFIPMAEESGLILPVGDWILDKAARQWREWNEQGMPWVTLAVNISAHQFYQADFLEKISRQVKQNGLDSFLEIEVTEGVMMKNIPVTLDIMHKLKAIGCKLSIDDFGTGYSSLGYISRFPLDKLKIDQSFVRAMLTSNINMAIVDTIIRLANNLHLKVIAEGVETEAELKALQVRNCDEIQGYYFASPMPMEDLLPWWRQWNKENRV